METDWEGMWGVIGDTGRTFTGERETQSMRLEVREEHQVFCADLEITVGNFHNKFSVHDGVWVYES